MFFPRQKEYITYTYTDFISTVGSYLGLFLGWSLLQITDQVWTTIRAGGAAYRRYRDSGHSYKNI